MRDRQVSSEVFGPGGPAFKLSLGDRGEMLAWGYLARAGFKILEKNYRTRFGELDVIAEKNKRLYFIEVKTRSTADKGQPEEAVTVSKQRRIVRLAAAYLQKSKKQDQSAAFGVISILWQPPRPPDLRWFENAFSLDDGTSL